MHKPHIIFWATLSVVLSTAVQADEQLDVKRRTFRPIANPRFDPAARRVSLFDGIEAGDITTKVIAAGPGHGVVLVTNNDSEAVTVELPDSFVAVHVLKQFGPANNNQAIFGPNNGNGQNNNNNGGQQAVGGGFSGLQNGPNGNAGPGNNNFPGDGFFSIPPEKTVKVPFQSACLEHGKPDPSPHAKYELVQTEKYTDNAALQYLLEQVTSGRHSRKSMQAAVWHLTDKMSWSELTAKHSYHIGRRIPYFSAREIQSAQLLVTQAEAASRSRQSQPEAAAVAGVSDRRR